MNENSIKSLNMSTMLNSVKKLNSNSLVKRSNFVRKFCLFVQFKERRRRAGGAISNPILQVLTSIVNNLILCSLHFIMNKY
jgi:hypothetical protein